VTAIAFAQAIPPQEPDDDDERQYQRALAQRTFQDNCLICHAEEMTTRQRLTPAQWKTEVEKMIGWGAPVPADETQRLIDFLAAEYSSEKPVGSVPRLAPAQVFGAGQRAETVPVAKDDGLRGAALYAVHCANCHGPEGQGGDLGPIVVERPVLLDPAGFRQVLRDGRRRMPSYRPVLSPSDETALLSWLRERRFIEQNR
jgi:ubiquinol-cytochrome c reductase cytochrome c subunit